MNRSIATILTIATIIFAVIFILVYSSKPNYDWTEHYYYKSEDPYGTLFIVELLKEYERFSEFKVMTKSFENHFDSSAASCDQNYVFIGDEYYLPFDRRQHLFRCIENGATALISANNFNDYDWDLFECSFTQSLWDTIAMYNFSDKQFSDDSLYVLKYKFENETRSYPWKLIRIEDTCEIYSPVQLRGYETICEEYNFIEISMGEGWLLLHSTPLAFSNIQLKNKAMKEYCEIVFSYLPERDTYWDEYHKVSRSGFFGEQQLSGPLQYILSQTSLRWAWYLLLFSSLLLVLFKSKREQKLIPVIEARKNTSLEFVKTIGKLYELEKDHKKLVKRKMDLFLTFIRDRLNISTSQINDDLVDKISLKTGKKQAEVRTLFDLYFSLLKSDKLSDRVILRYNRLLERFYKDLY